MLTSLTVYSGEFLVLLRPPVELASGKPFATCWNITNVAEDPKLFCNEE